MLHTMKLTTENFFEKTDVSLSYMRVPYT